MAKSRNNHVGFRNGNLFCFNCGTSYNMQLPQAIDMAGAIMKQFGKSHSSCPKTWTEPIAETNNKSEIENAEWWASNGEHGISSKTMFNRLSQKLGIRRVYNNWGECHPSDPDDFKRCYKLLKAVPQWKERLHELKTISPVWEKLVDNWDKLTAMYEQNEKEQWKNYKKIGMYEFMKTLGC